jgi:hypothetical protein
VTKDEENCLKLGRQVVRMIRDVRAVVETHQTGYARQRITFPGGSINLFVVNDDELADVFDAAAARRYDVKDTAGPSQLN